jgi:cytidine deaminase
MDAKVLIDAALAVRANAYAPYSHYRVGAAVEGASGRVFSGCNVENASYGLTVCAERVAICTAVAAGETALLALAVVTEDGATPCGACRQMLLEFGVDTRVYVARADGTHRETTLSALCPRRSGHRTRTDAALRRVERPLAARHD